MDVHDLFPDAPRPDPGRRIRAAATKIRSLRSQVGHDGLTPSAARVLIEELTAALDACASALSDEPEDTP
jgi:hypothetical protein